MQRQQYQREINHDSDRRARRKKQMKRRKRIFRIKVIFVILGLIAAIGAFLFCTPAGRKILVSVATEYAYNKVDFKGNETQNGEKTGPNIDASKMSETFRNARHEDYCTNILLLGVEAIGYGEEKGHTDAIMIATINKKEGTMKLTSLMRDSYVSIPGYDSDRINSVYRKGGIELLYETIAQNYNLQLDGYGLVDFDTFEKVIDAVGGIDITLTAEEAEYLNTTNYISDPANRNVVEGTQTMNGNQALGYARVRHVATLDGSNDDMGRTYRQRAVVNAIFEKVKSSGVVELTNLMNTVLPLVQTDVKKANCKTYLEDALNIGFSNLSLNTLRIPADNMFSYETINGKAVVLPDWDQNLPLMQQFIFATGDESTTATDTSQE